MPRNMSFSMTTEAVRNRTKTVTRRLGWDFLKPGDLLWACEKCQGLKKGEKVKRLALIRVVSVQIERLTDIVDYYARPALELEREGFPDVDEVQFVEMFSEHNHCDIFAFVNRIEFEYVDEASV